MEDIFRIGVITSTHGLKGEVKVFPTTDDLNRFKTLKKCFIRTPKEDIQVEKNTCKFFKNMVILKFKGIDNVDDVQKYRQKDLYVARKDAVKLYKDEYFIADLIGLAGVSDEGEDLGELTDVIQTGANDVYVFTKMGEPDLLVPKIPDCVKEIDLEKGTVLVHLLPGLRD